MTEKRKQIINIFFGQIEGSRAQVIFRLIKRVLSVVLLLIALIILWVERRYKVFFFFTEHVRFTPTLISGLCALALILPLYMRGIFSWSSEHGKVSVIDIISFALILTVTASLVQMVLGNNLKLTFQVWLLVIGICLSWLGMRPLAGLSWLLLLASMVSSILKANKVLEFDGYLLVLCTSLGLLSNTRIPFKDLCKEIWATYGQNAERIVQRMREDAEETGKSISKKIS